MDEKQIREIIKSEFDKNYYAGNPAIPPHTHNGVDNLQIRAADILGLSSSLGGFTGLQVFTSSGTFNVPTGFTKFFVRAAGGGQGGGYANTSASAGSAGLAGDYVENTVTVSTSTVSVTIGTGGAGATTAGSGAAGGDTSFGSSVVAKGGSSGTTSVGTLIISSMSGATPSLTLSAIGSSTNVSILSAQGGCNILGLGAQGVVGTPGSQTNGNNGQGYGGGGSGGASGTAGLQANGGNGADGVVIVSW